MNKAEEHLESEKRIDILFMNEPARISFLQLRGFTIPEKIEDCKGGASILTLARGDVYMTAMLRCITLTGKGGSRNDVFVECFKRLSTTF